jgi:predicted component of viral defense system (DUF524 family)
MYQAVIGGMNFFGLFSERLAKRMGYKEFSQIRKM